MWAKQWWPQRAGTAEPDGAIVSDRDFKGWRAPVEMDALPPTDEASLEVYGHSYWGLQAADSLLETLYELLKMKTKGTL